MPSRRPAAASSRLPAQSLEIVVAKLTEWKEQHELRCEERADEFRREAEGIHKELRGIRADIGRQLSALGTTKPDAPALSAEEIARLVKDAVRAATAAPAADKSFLERVLSVAQNLVTILGGLGAALLAGGVILNWLGHASTSAGAHFLPPH